MTTRVHKSADPQLRKRLDTAARAAWLYYIGSRTQDDIASELGVSRQNVQRLIALALSERLIKFRLDHDLGPCFELAERLRERFGLKMCEVVPADSASDGNRLGVGIAAAQLLEGFLAQKDGITVGIGTGRTLREAIRQVQTVSRPQHKIVSLVGNIARDGRASPYEVLMRLADRIEAPCYLLPMPVVTDTAAEREMLQRQRSFSMISSLLDDAEIHIMGISHLAAGSPLHVDGFISEAELDEMVALGGVGEMRGWTFDAEGRILDGGYHHRLTSVPLSIKPRNVGVVVGAGQPKVTPIRAALGGGLANGLITDETTAAAILARA